MHVGALFKRGQYGSAGERSRVRIANPFTLPPSIWAWT